MIKFDINITHVAKETKGGFAITILFYSCIVMILIDLLEQTTNLISTSFSVKLCFKNSIKDVEYMNKTIYAKVQYVLLNVLSLVIDFKLIYTLIIFDDFD